MDRSRVKRNRKRVKLLVFLMLAGLTYFIFCLPTELFKAPFSTVVKSGEGEVLAVRIAQDEQWRLPVGDSIPLKIQHCTLQFEDAHFYSHPGINPISIIKALYANSMHGGVKRGGSTLTQQSIRLARGNPSRSYFEKFVEMIWALRLEFRYSKEEILKLYLDYAPYGGNIVGVETASWRYYGRPAEKLSWSESATLAVLPNAPGLIFPGRNKGRLKKKRDFLLMKLHTEGIIDALTRDLAIDESLPNKKFPLPKEANHLLLELEKRGKGKIYQTHLNKQIQRMCGEKLSKHHARLSGNEIQNGAVLVIDLKENKLIAYQGNVKGVSRKYAPQVDCIQAPRSTGSILKPFLYGLSIEEGLINRKLLLPDIPKSFSGYAPQNFNKTFQGAVPAEKALSASLNLPAVLMLQKYHPDKFLTWLQKNEQNHIDKTADHYGLSLILGGAESSLWDLAQLYANMARTLNDYQESYGKYSNEGFRNVNILANNITQEENWSAHSGFMNAGACWDVVEMLSSLTRPDIENEWRNFNSSYKIAWKTGTSFGFRDAWSIGMTSEYLVAVWVGNASGEGRAGLTGIKSAAPLMFDVFSGLPRSKWFKPPYDELRKKGLCKKSGLLPSDYCPIVDSVWLSTSAENVGRCTYHKRYLVDENEQYRHAKGCSVKNLEYKTYFELSPVMHWYYRNNNHSLVPAPPVHMSCTVEDFKPLRFIYPNHKARLKRATGMGGKKTDIIAELAHTQKDAIVYWYLGDRFLGETKHSHLMQLDYIQSGLQNLRAIDQWGNSTMIQVDIAEK